MFLEKSICIPATPPVDVAAFLPIISHRHFQCLRDRKQLGLNALIFPGAVHTRFEHTLGVLSLAQRLCRIQQLSAHDAKLIQAFALLHDIGHGPYSHQIEPVLQGNHHDRGQQRILDMKDAIYATGLDPDEIAEMLAEKHTLAHWISDRNLGADKLDYLMRDALHIGFHGTPDIEKIQFYTAQTPDGLAISQKFIEDVKQVQKFYSYLHQHGYLNKTALAAQRMLQRAVQQELMEQHASGDDLWDMSDHQLQNWLAQTRHPIAQRLTRRLDNRNLLRTALAIKPLGYAYEEHQAAKPIAIREWQRTDLRKFDALTQAPNALLELEDALADACGLPPGDILFAAMPYFKKLIPKDVRVFTGSPHDGFWLFEKDPDHHKSLESDYLRTYAIRVVVPEEKRRDIANQADTIEGIIRNAINSPHIKADH